MFESDHQVDAEALHPEACRCSRRCGRDPITGHRPGHDDDEKAVCGPLDEDELEHLETERAFDELLHGGFGE